MSSLLLNDVTAMKPFLASLPTDWEGKASVLQMKKANYHWRQMEWWGFYFELLCSQVLDGVVTFPGDRFGNVTFDMQKSINWDLKSKAIRSDSHEMTLNDQAALNESIAKYGQHGVVVALCDVEYNDTERTFQRWHTELKGGLSKYEQERQTRTSISRYRKTHAWLTEILFLSIDETNLPYLDTMRQGRNSNGNPRAVKYSVDLEKAEPFIVDKIVFG